jgi:hypothetical protein
MGYTRSDNDIVNEYIDSLGEEIAPLFLDVRACILAAGPVFNESIKWKNCLVYGTTRNHIQTVVGKGKISLIFFDGAALGDRYGLLEGDGTKTRTMRITSPDFNQQALSDYVQQTLSEQERVGKK